MYHLDFIKISINMMFSGVNHSHSITDGCIRMCGISCHIVLRFIYLPLYLDLTIDSECLKVLTKKSFFRTHFTTLKDPQTICQIFFVSKKDLEK